MNGAWGSAFVTFETVRPFRTIVRQTALFQALEAGRPSGGTRGGIVTSSCASARPTVERLKFSSEKCALS